MPKYLSYAVEQASLEDKLEVLKSKWLEQLSKLYPQLKEDSDKMKVWSLLLSADPTKNKQYLQWILVKGISGWKHKGVKLFQEDAYKITDNLTIFELAKKKNKLKPEHKDIGRVASNEDLWEIMQGYSSDEMTSNKDKKSSLEQSFYATKAAELVYDSPTAKVIKLNTQEASCYFGTNTQWCTAAKNDNMFKQYDSKGKLYVILDKAKNKRWQILIPKDRSLLELMDEKDAPATVKGITVAKEIRSLLENLVLGSRVLSTMPGITNYLNVFDSGVSNPGIMKAMLPNLKVGYDKQLKGHELKDFSSVNAALIEAFSAKNPPLSEVITKGARKHPYIDYLGILVNREDNLEALVKLVQRHTGKLLEPANLHEILPFPKTLPLETKLALCKRFPDLTLFVPEAEEADRLTFVTKGYRPSIVPPRFLPLLNPNFLNTKKLLGAAVKRGYPWAGGDYLRLANTNLLIEVLKAKGSSAVNLGINLADVDGVAAAETPKLAKIMNNILKSLNGVPVESLRASLQYGKLVNSKFSKFFKLIDAELITNGPVSKIPEAVLNNFDIEGAAVFSLEKAFGIKAKISPLDYEDILESKTKDLDHIKYDPIHFNAWFKHRFNIWFKHRKSRTSLLTPDLLDIADYSDKGFTAYLFKTAIEDVQHLAYGVKPSVLVDLNALLKSVPGKAAFKAYCRTNTITIKFDRSIDESFKDKIAKRLSKCGISLIDYKVSGKTIQVVVQIP